MKTLFILALTAVMASMAAAQVSQHTRPWDNPSNVIVIDAYGPNVINWDKMKTDTRVVGVIHRATQGKTLDNKYAARKAKALEMGYLFGSYHLGLAGDPVRQADFYLAQVGNAKNELLSLDLEMLDSKHMSLSNAEAFITRVHEKTGRYPFIYCNNDVFKAINALPAGNNFSKCRLWYARFKPNITGYNNGHTWNDYTLWQFSCEVNCQKTGTCLYNVPGTAFDMDINVFNGNRAELENIWTANP